MKLLCFFIFCIFLSINATAQTDLGTGLISIHFDSKTILHFYSMPTDKEPAKTISFFDDKSINSWNIKNLDEQKKWLMPEVLWLDYDYFIFRCLKEDNGYYNVIVNNQTGKSYWIKKSAATVFSTYENYLKEMFGVGRLTAMPIKESPTEASATIKYSGTDCFRVRQMKGDWIEIFTADYCDEDSGKPKIKSGWIQWKQGNKLLIEYYLTG